MGQNNSMEDHHLDGAIVSPHAFPISVGPAAGAHSQRPVVPVQQQQQHHMAPPIQPQPGQSQAGIPAPSAQRVPAPIAVGGGVAAPHRDDSGNDFAMSIADGGAQRGDGTVETPSGAAISADPPPNLPSPPPTQPKIETVPTAFKWVHGGSEVYVTGSFNNWQGKILMYANDDNEFTLLIDIPPGTHHYKYIVDQEWRLDDDAPTVQIANVWNNVVEVKRPVFEYTPANFADSDDDEDERTQKTAYGQRAPLSLDYVGDPPKLPPHLTEVLLNQTQPQDPMMLPVPMHVVLNHLYVMHHPDPAVLVTGLTQRFRPNPHTKITHKFVTTVYYAPRDNIDMHASNGPHGAEAHAHPHAAMHHNYGDPAATMPDDLRRH